MKVNRKGLVKVEKGEIRIGNFFIKDEGSTEHYKVQDLNSVFVVRVWKRIPLGIWLTNILSMKEKGHETLKAWISVVWSMLSVVPDQEFIEGIMKETKACLDRHPDWYGAKKDATEEEHAKAVEQVEGMKEFEMEVKELADKAD